VLVNSAPRPARAWKVVQGYVGRRLNVSVEEMITDPNGDRLAYDMSPVDQKRLQVYGLYFEVQGRVPRVVGRAMMPGTLGKVTVRGTDIHGAWTEVYLTIKIDDYRVARRDKPGGYQDVEVMERRRFSFKIDEDLFYDQEKGQPLVLFATDMADLSLPNWKEFDPHDRCFSG